MHRQNLELFDQSAFFRIGASKLAANGLSYADVSTFDATLYDTNAPRKCLVRQETTIRPHLIRSLNILDREGKESLRQSIQAIWEKADCFAYSLGNVQQCFLVITPPTVSVAKHSHGSHLSDTVTVVYGCGERSTAQLCFSHQAAIPYPQPGYIKAVCFESNIEHWTIADNNYFFHFVYDYEQPVSMEKRVWMDI